MLRCRTVVRMIRVRLLKIHFLEWSINMTTCTAEGTGFNDCSLVEVACWAVVELLLLLAVL